MPPLFLIKAGLELGQNTHFTLESFTAVSEIESIAVATDGFAAIIIAEPYGPSLSNIEPL